MRDIILDKLSKIEREYGVDILFAVESGSRAWGMDSPDSDYDVRFVYKRPLSWYVAIHDRRDVIEPKCEHPLDINGWDIRKALYQLKRGNPAFFEWLYSPQYVAKHSYLEDIAGLSKIYFNSKTAIYHYMHMASGNYRQYIVNKEQPLLKKYLYVIRPILCCEWIAHNNSQPPRDLMDNPAVSLGVRQEVEDLLKAKRLGDELGASAPRPALNAYIEERLEHFKKFSQTTAKGVESADILNDYLFKVVG